MSALTPMADTAVLLRDLYFWCVQAYYLGLLCVAGLLYAGIIFATMVGIAIESSLRRCHLCAPLPLHVTPPYWLLLLYWQLRDHRRLGHADN